MDGNDSSPLSMWSWFWPPSRWAYSQRQAYNQMRRRHLWGLYNAASKSVQALADHVRKEGPAVEYEAFEPLVQELRVIRDRFRGDAKLSVALSGLFSFAEQAGGGAQSTVPPVASAFVSALDSLARALEAERRTLAAWAPDHTNAATPAAASVLSSQPPSAEAGSPADGGGGSGDSERPPLSEEPAEDQALNRNEAAILASITEKYYKSWAFRIVGLALVAAAFLAGAGSLFLGEKTLSLRDDLEKTEKKGEDEIKDHTKGLQESIDKQMTALSVATTEIQTKRDAFEADLTVGRDRIKAEIDDFSSKSNGLQKKIADEVVERLDRQLKDSLSEISGKIGKKGEEALSHIDVAENNLVTPLTKRNEGIAENLNHLEETIAADEVELRKQGPTLDRLEGVGAKLDEVTNKLGSVEAKEQALAGSVAQASTQASLAGSHAQEAQRSAELTSDARKNAESDLQAISRTAAEKERAIGAAGARIDNLNKQIEAYETKLRGGLPVTFDSAALTDAVAPLTARVAKVEDRLEHPPTPAPPDLGPLTARVAKVEDRLEHPAPIPPPPDLGPLTARVAKLEDRLDHPPAAPFPATEADLTVDQKMQIQKALHVYVDGTIGPNTRLAIQRLRRSRNVTTTGDLTRDEIKELLSARDL